MDVKNHHFSGSKLYFEVLYESHTKKYNDYTRWLSPETALLDCWEEDLPTNSVVDYVKSIAKYADLHEKSKVQAVIFKTIQKTQELKDYYKADYYKPEDLVPGIENCKCTRKHDNPLDDKDFEAVTFSGYFMKEDRKHGWLQLGKCAKCKHPLLGDKKPTLKNPVYVCRTTMKENYAGNCTGQSIWCNACAAKTNDNNGARASRSRTRT